MDENVSAAGRWLSEGVSVGRAVLVHSSGSAPFEVGSTLYVAEDGRMAGSVSVGCVEGAAVEAVLAAQLGRYRELVHYGVSDERAASVGLSCGGAIDVLVEPRVPAEVLAAATGERTIAVVTPLPAGREPADVPRAMLGAIGLSGSLGDADADAALAEMAADLLDGSSRVVRLAGREVYVEVVRRERLVVVGAGDIAVHLVALASAFGLRTVVVDARSAFLTRERFPAADALLLGWADELADRAEIDRDAYVVALAHDPKYDDPALITALRCGARYVGALGSRRTHAARLDRLREARLTEDELARIHAPIGIDLGGHRPADIALGILAEIVAERNRGAMSAQIGGGTQSGVAKREADDA